MVLSHSDDWVMLGMVLYKICYLTVRNCLSIYLIKVEPYQVESLI